MTTDRIDKQIEIAASVSRVWKALTDHREFGQWFRVNLESPFVVAKRRGVKSLTQVTSMSRWKWLPKR